MSIRMKIKKKIIKTSKKKIIFSVLSVMVFFFCIFYTSSVSAATVSFQMTDNGLPMEGEKIWALNYEKAYEKISSGEYNKEDKQSADWEDFSQQSPDGNQGIKLPTGQILNSGIKYSREETFGIIRFLYSYGHINLLQALNESSAFGSSASNLVQPRTFTDISGKANFEIPEGVTLFAYVNGNNAVLGVAEVQEKTHLKFDISNLDDRLSVTDALHKAQSGGERQYSVEYGQEITYHIHLSKSFLNTVDANGSLTIMPSSNLVIDDISLPSQKNDLLGNSINPNNYLVPNSDGTSPTPWDQITQTNQSQIAETLGQALVQKSLYGYQLDLPTEDTQDFSLTVHAHIEPLINITKTLSLNGISVEQNIPINAISDPSSNFNLDVTANNGTETLQAKSPSINTSGINFVMTNDTADKLVKGASYVLGKEINGQKYLYDGANWQLESTSFTTANAEVFTGGKQYIIGTGDNEIPILSDRYGLTVDKVTTVNASLIQIRGLAQGEYFLQSIQPEKKDPIKFKVYSKNTVTANGNALVRNSIAYAENSAFNVNGQIPDYSADSNEYNILNTKAGANSAFNWGLMILLPILLLIVLMIVIAFILIYRF